MSRPRRTPVESGETVFLQEIRTKQGHYNMMTQTKLAENCGIPQTTLSRRFRNVEDFTVAELRQLIDTLEPDPLAVLLLLGYQRKAIQRYVKYAAGQTEAKCEAAE